MSFLRRIQNFILSFRCLKWIGLIVAFYLWLYIIPPAIWCVIPGLAGFIVSLIIEISVPAVLVLLNEYRKARIWQACKIGEGFEFNPKAFDEYLNIPSVKRKREKDA